MEIIETLVHPAMSNYGDSTYMIDGVDGCSLREFYDELVNGRHCVRGWIEVYPIDNYQFIGRPLYTIGVKHNDSTNIEDVPLDIQKAPIMSKFYHGAWGHNVYITMLLED